MCTVCRSGNRASKESPASKRRTVIRMSGQHNHAHEHDHEQDHWLFMITAIMLTTTTMAPCAKTPRPRSIWRGGGRHSRRRPVAGAHRQIERDILGKNNGYAAENRARLARTELSR